MTYDSSEAEKITGKLRRRPGPPTESSEPRAKVNAKISIKYLYSVLTERFFD